MGLNDLTLEQIWGWGGVGKLLLPSPTAHLNLATGASSPRATKIMSHSLIVFFMIRCKLDGKCTLDIIWFNPVTFWRKQQLV